MAIYKLPNFSLTSNQPESLTEGSRGVQRTWQVNLACGSRWLTRGSHESDNQSHRRDPRAWQPSPTNQPDNGPYWLPRGSHGPTARSHQLTWQRVPRAGPAGLRTGPTGLRTGPMDDLTNYSGWQNKLCGASKPGIEPTISTPKRKYPNHQAEASHVIVDHALFFLTRRIWLVRPRLLCWRLGPLLHKGAPWFFFTISFFHFF
jgi:hypothetical protein